MSPVYTSKNNSSNQTRSKSINPSTPTTTTNKSPSLIEQSKKSQAASTQSQTQMLKNQKSPQYMSTANMVRQPLKLSDPYKQNLTNFSNNYYKSDFMDNNNNTSPAGNSNFGSPKTNNMSNKNKLPNPTAQNNLTNTNKNILSNPSAVTNPYNVNNNNVSYNPMFSSNNLTNKSTASIPNYYSQIPPPTQYYQPPLQTQIQPQNPQTIKGNQYKYMMPQYAQQSAQTPQMQPQYSQYYQKTSF
jgi:hypothetical protein